MKRLDRLLLGVQKLVTKKSLSTTLAVVGTAVIGLATLPVINVSASTVGEEFSTATDLQNGLLVSINPESPDSIELASLGTGKYSLGIINDTQSNVITFAKDNATVSVALSGEVLVYVSNANGEIKVGDFIGVSWLEGVGMKALTNQDQKLLGVALEDYDGSEASEYGNIETANGNKDVSVDVIKVRLFDKEGSVDAINSTNQTTSLENFANSIAGKSVNPIRILAGALIFIMGIALAGFFAYSSIKGSFISVGRNPMASDSIYRSLTQVSMISVAALVIGAALAYVVLVV